MLFKLIWNITSEILTNFNLDIRISNDHIFLYFSVSPKVVDIKIVFTQKSMVF